jgi:transcriptional regulator with XRE-family HTH domain
LSEKALEPAPHTADQPVGEVLGFPPRGGPTVLRLLLGSRLRELREAAGISAEEAGYAIRGSHSKISRLENGRVGFKRRDVADLLTLYGVADEGERTAIIAMVEKANTPGWWHQFGDVLPNWFEVYLGLEEAAALVRTYEVHFVPGLLQTEDYARAVVQLGFSDAYEEEIERRVNVRMTRQQRLMSAAGPALWAVIDETALRRSIGGPAVMRAQIQRLIELAELPNVTLQVIPFHAGGNASASGPFTILRFREPALSDVVYLEHLTSALYLDKPSDVEVYLRAINSLCVAAGKPQETIHLLNTILEER